MVSLIIGNKGSGKTKRLIEQVNQASDASEGNVVCIEKEPKLTYDIRHSVRLISTDTYGLTGYPALYGFLCGICAGNYDVTDILMDATLKIGGRDFAALADFLEKAAALSQASDTRFIFTVSCEESELPAGIFKICQKL